MRIVPPANEQHRQAHGSRAKCRRYVVPVAAARRIIEPSFVMGVMTEASEKIGPRGDRRMKRHAARKAKKNIERFAVAGEPRGLRADLSCPTEPGGKAKGVIFVGPVGADIPADHRRRERFEGGRAG